MAELGHGTTLVGATTGDVGHISNLSGSDATRGSVDVSDFDSTNKNMEFIPALLDSGEITFDVVYEKAVYDLMEDARSAVPEVWTITIPDTSTFASSGFVTAVGKPSAATDGAFTFSASIKLSGAITFTPAV